MVDSGAQKSVLAESAARAVDLPVRPSNNVWRVRYGDGGVAKMSNETKIGRKVAIVDPNGGDSYIAVNDLVGGNNKVMFSAKEATVTNDVLHKTVHMTHDDHDMWRLSIKDACAVTQWPYDQMLNQTTITNARIVRVVMPAAEKRKKLTRLVRLHRIYGHPPIEVMWKAIKYNHWRNSGIKSEEVRKLWANHKCAACIMAKSNKIPKSIATDIRTTVPGEVISGDPMPVDIPGVSKATQIYLFKDVCTQYWHGFLSTTKTEFVDCLEKVIQWYKRQGKKPLIFRSDNEVLLRDAKMTALLERHNMTKQSSAPYQHYQNTVERDVQTLVKKISCVLHDQPMLPAKWWDYVFWHEIELHNRIPNTSTATQTPISMVCEKEHEKFTNVANTFNFEMGELVGIGIPKEHRLWKFDTKRELGVYVGQPEGQVDSHLIYFPYTDNVMARADVIPLNIPEEDLAKFYMIRAGMQKSQSVYGRVKDLAQAVGIASDYPKVEPERMRTGVETVIPPRMATRNRPQQFVDEAAFNMDICSEQECSTVSEKFEKYFGGIPEISHQTDFTQEPNLELIWRNNQIPEISYQTDFSEQADLFSNDILNDEGPGPGGPSPFDKDKMENSFYDVNARRVHNAENPTVTQALNGDKKEFWKVGIREEVFENLLKTDRVSLQAVDFSEVPRDALITYLTFVLKKKIKPDREDRYKARGCMRGDLTPNKDLVETFSPTVSSLTCAALQQIAVIDEMEQQLVDTVGAFLGQDYPDSAPALYVKLDRKVAEVCGLDPDQVYRVVKYLYGIPDAGRAYYKAYRDTLIEQGYTQNEYDPCLFHLQGPNGVIYAWIHVDDTWVAASTKEMMSDFIKSVETRFEVTVEDVDNYLGVHYQPLPNGDWKKTQPKLLADLFKRHNIKDKKYVKTPATTPSDVERDITPCDQTEYLSLLGTLLYLHFSRPDIGFAISYGATKAAAPVMADYQDLVRVVQYLYQTREKGLLIKKQPKGCPLQMFIHVDASFLLYEDSKGQTGYCLSLNDMGIFYAKSQKQSVVTTSSTHAEMRALFVAVCEYLFLELLFASIGRPLVAPAIVYEDNQPVVTLLTREGSIPKRSKHFVMLVNYVREMINQGKVEIRKIGTEFNFSDIWTKPVYGRDFAYKCQKVLGIEEGEQVLEPMPKKKKASEGTFST